MITLGIRKSNLNGNTKIIGITGTHGKTIVSSIISHILTKSNFKVATLTSQGLAFSEEEIEPDITANSVQKSELKEIIKQVNAQDYDFLILEITSKNIQRKTYPNIILDSGIITNIEGDTTHWKFWQEYAETKVEFIKMIKENGLLVVNGEGVDAVEWLRKNGDEIKNDIFCYWVNSSNLKDKALTLNSSKFRYYDNQIWESKLIGHTSALNLYLAIKVCTKYVEEWEIRKALQSYRPIKGRFDRFYTNPFNIIIDYAKTPEQIEASLSFLHKNKNPNSKIISVFGSHGGKWQSNRRAGEYLAKLSDIVLLAPNDPNKEHTYDINSAIHSFAEPHGGRLIERVFSNEETNMLRRDNLLNKMEQIKKHGEVPFISFDAHDYSGRLDAISFALTLADEPDDIVYISGKGDESYLIFDGVEYEWSDYEAIRLALESLGLV
ncbi:MAG: UDP-N-acetylmuramoyl-L-alanyl-D-glutamate--2,6-diaminopimelate ligase [Candidatus Dojkabacteria bacterium]